MNVQSACKLGVISQERLKIDVKLILSAIRMPRRLAQERMSLSDFEWPFYASRAISAVAELLVVSSLRQFTVTVHTLPSMQVSSIIDTFSHNGDHKHSSSIFISPRTNNNNTHNTKITITKAGNQKGNAHHAGHL